MELPDARRIRHDLAALISTPTQNPPGREIEAARLVETLLADVGFRTTVNEFRRGRANVVAQFENGPGPTFAFNTHLDVVPAGGGWTSDPFVLKEEAGRAYGRGACDCKGPLASMIEAMRMLVRQRFAWSGTLLGVFVADEEHGSEGARLYTATSPEIDFVVVGEPTSNGTFTAHKGSIRPLVRVHGKSAHSGMPHLGDNAIYRAASLLKRIELFHEQVVRTRHHPLAGDASLTVTRIEGGEADNAIPAHVDLLFDRRMVPGEDEATVKAELAALLDDVAASGVQAEIIGYRPTTGGPTETPIDASIVQASLAACRRHGVGDPGPFGLGGACDLVHFRQAGATGTVIGPGSLSVAHRPDEFVPIDELVAASRIYTDIALQMMPR